MIDQLITDLRDAADAADAEAAVKVILADFVRDPAAAKSSLPDDIADDVILFEDDRGSIWFCRFPPGASVPPHNHRMSATIGVFQGWNKTISTAVMMPPCLYWRKAHRLLPVRWCRSLPMLSMG